MSKMKINYPFKKYDWVDCSERTEEEIQAMLERMRELGANKGECIGSFYRRGSNCLSWRDHYGTYFLSSDHYREEEGYNEILWKDILPTITTDGLEELSSIDQELSLYEEPKSIPPVTEWKCFEQVAKVLGEESAEYELNLIRSNELDGNKTQLLVDQNLMNAFAWGNAPKGFDFWYEIDEGRLPNSYKKKEEKIQTEEDISNTAPTPTPNKRTFYADKINYYKRLINQNNYGFDNLTEAEASAKLGYWEGRFDEYTTGG